MVTGGKGRYVAGDRAGLSGIQGQYDALLGGTAGVTVTVAGAAPATTLFEQPAQDGKNLTLALDPAVQAAAEKALAGSKDVPSALVAVDVKSGDLLAVANSPELGFDRALVGRYQPGSTLKVATTYSLPEQGPVPVHARAVPAEGHGRRSDGQELRGRDVRRRALHHRLRRVVQHRLRRPLRHAWATPTSTTRPRPSASAPAGRSTSAWRAPSAARARGREQDREGRDLVRPGPRRSRRRRRWR